MTKPNRWALIILALLIIIVAGGLTAWARYPQSQPIEITAAQSEGLSGGIYISGAVASPGFYPLKAGDTIDGLIQSAGVTKDADLGRIELNIPKTSDRLQPQKIDINRAESWLLQALPGIGATRARAIIDYRNQNGPFRYTYELTKVEGIGAELYENIKHLISVNE